jgi:hypothetical protein
MYNKSKNVIPITDLRGHEDFGTSRLPHFLDNRFTDGGEVVCLVRQPHFTPQEDSWTLFLLEAESARGPSATGRIKSIEKNAVTSSGLEPATFRLVA